MTHLPAKPIDADNHHALVLVAKSVHPDENECQRKRSDHGDKDDCLLTVCSHSAQFRASLLRANLAISTSSTTNASITAPILCNHSQAPIAPTILKSTVVVSSQSARSFISPASMPRPRPIPD